jgi:tRNA(Ile)-lysidine synthetase-like protein
MSTMTPDPEQFLLAAVRGAIETFDLLPRATPGHGPTEPVIVGTSGGPDSVALLHVLVRLSQPAESRRVCACTHAEQPCLNIAPIVAHLNHGLRGADADEDQRFVEELAARLGLPCEVGRADVSTEAATQGVGIEEAARQVRRQFLADVACRRGARKIALGHHGDDRAETVLFHILRGTGVEGLAALGPRSPVLAAEGLEIVRPLIAVRRDPILAYLAPEGLPYREDATNDSAAFTRNRIRGELLPLLREKFNPKVDEALTRLADQAAAASEVLAAALETTWRAIVQEAPAAQAPDTAGEPISQAPDTAEGSAGSYRSPATPALIIDADDFAPLAPWLQGAILRRAIEHLGGGMKYMSAERTREVVSALLSKSFAGPIDLPGGLVVARRRRTIRIEKGSAERGVRNTE